MKELVHIKACNLLSLQDYSLHRNYLRNLMTFKKEKNTIKSLRLQISTYRNPTINPKEEISKLPVTLVACFEQKTCIYNKILLVLTVSRIMQLPQIVQELKDRSRI